MKQKLTIPAAEAVRPKTFLDMIAPAKIQFFPDYYICGSTFRSVWALKDYPPTTEKQALLRHLGEKDNVTLHLFTRLVSAGGERQIYKNATNSARLRRSNAGDIQQAAVAETNLENMGDIARQQVMSREPFLHTAVFIELTANGKEELTILQAEVEAELSRSKLTVDKLFLCQQEGFRSVQPAGKNQFGCQMERVLPASSVANLYPFVYSGKTDAKGIYLGRDKYGSNIIVDFDQRSADKTNGNILILGNSGQGKSYLMKLIFCNFLEAGKSLICLDPDGEYRELTLALGGSYLDLLDGAYRINVLEPRPCQADTGEDNDSGGGLSRYISFLRDFFASYKSFSVGNRSKIMETTTQMKEQLLKKIHDYTLTCGVVGLGYVELPLAVEKAKAGFKTLGFDVQAPKVEMVNRGHNYIGDVIDDDLSALVREGMLRATTDFSFVKDMDFIAICVPTPLDEHQQPDISYVRSSAEAIAKYLKKGTMVVLESTTYPGTTEELIRPILETSGLKCGVDFYLGFSPERVDPGNAVFKTKNTPKVVGAIGADALECIAAVYRAVLGAEVHTVSSPAIAEMEKILENTYRNINIGLINELAILCNRMGINIWEVVEAAKSKPYGFQPFYPGPGLGGHCIPLDPYYLSWKAREYGFHTSMIESSMMINDKMPEYCVERAGKILNTHQKALNGANVLVLGVAYKQDIDDYRESPAIRVIEELQKTGAQVVYFDPYVPKFQYGSLTMESVPALTAEILSNADIVLITTAHTSIDYGFVQKYAKAVFDTKNAMKAVKQRENIEVL